MRICAVLIVAVLVGRVAMFLYAPTQVLATNGIYDLTFTRVDTLLVGAWIALWLRGTLLMRSELHRLAAVAGGSCLAVLLAGVGMTIGRWPTVASNPFLSTVGYSLVAVVGGSFLLLALDDELLLTRWLLSPWLTGLGTISYGFYVLHGLPLPFVVAMFSRFTLGMRTAGVFLTFLVVAGVSLASFVYFESRFIRLKATLAPRPRGAASTPNQPGI